GGTCQSNTAVPLGTSYCCSAIRPPTRASVWRTPFPVMLRQIGNSSRANAYARAPSSLQCSRVLRRSKLICCASRSMPGGMARVVSAVALDIKGARLAITLADDADRTGPADTECGVVVAIAVAQIRLEQVGHVVQHARAGLLSLEAMCEAGRDVNGTTVALRELHRAMP